MGLSVAVVPVLSFGRPLHGRVLSYSIAMGNELLDLNFLVLPQLFNILRRFKGGMLAHDLIVDVDATAVIPQPILLNFIIV